MVFAKTFRDKIDRIKLNAVPSEIKADLEREIELLRSENQRIQFALRKIA